MSEPTPFFTGLGSGGFGLKHEGLGFRASCLGFEDYGLYLEFRV